MKTHPFGASFKTFSFRLKMAFLLGLTSPEREARLELFC